jgi:protein Tex
MKNNEFYYKLINQETQINPAKIAKVVELLSEGATIPFIARYRKEVTGDLDEVQIDQISKLYKKYEDIDHRKETIINAINEQGKLTEDLRSRIVATYDLNELEDLYLPYKRRRKSRADIAKEKGLEPLAKIILKQEGINLNAIAEKFINENVATIAEGIQGAQDIIAEIINETESIREYLRKEFRNKALISSKVQKGKEEEAKQTFKDYIEFSESLSKCPSHRYLAMMRGEKEGLLRVIIDIDQEEAINYLSKVFVTGDNECSDIVYAAIVDCYKRLTVLSIENQIRSEFKEKADKEAITVFSNNARQLLLAPPLLSKNIMAIDPGFRTGCKVVCLDDKGDFLTYENIFPHEPQRQAQQSAETIKALAYKHNIDAIAIGNGTASRETKEFISQIKFEKNIHVFVVSENGASIYSASEIAREEFPDKDITVRGAISIGRRLMDPLAELVKIDPKSIGVGQYQHDVDQTMLKESLDTTVMLCVNSVGINLNSASEHLLRYVSGLGPVVSSNIVKYRSENGPFNSRAELMKVPRLGAKVFEQAAGFLRVRDGHHPLDNTAVHPEAYPIVDKMAVDMGVDIEKLIADKNLRKQIRLDKYVTKELGIPTLQDIMKELDKPGLDPRGEAQAFSFAEGIKSLEDLRDGMTLPGIVTNMTNFGAFVDIGIKGDALLHISQITRKFIKSPAEVLKLHQTVNVTILNIDYERKRVNLTMLS